MALIQGIVDTQKQNLKSLGIVNSGDDLTIELEVKQNGVNIEFVNPIFELLATKSDGTRVRQLVDITYIGNVVNIIGDEQLVTSPGIVTLQLIIKDNKRSSTCLFYFMCGTSLDRDIIQSISKVEVLNQLDEYVVQAFANLKEYEQRIIASDASIRNLNEDMIKAEKVRVQAEINRGNTFDNLVLKMNNAINAAIATDETLQNNEIKRIDNYNTLKVELESIKDDLILLNNNISKEEEKRVQAEIDRVNKALEIIEKLKSTNDKVTIAEAERVTEFNNIKSELTSLKEALTTINNIANSNEEIRKTNESGRVAAEQQRVTDFEKIKSDNTSLGVALTKKVDDKIVEIEANNNTFKQGINEQYDTIVQQNNNFQTEMNTDYGDAKVDYFGEEHINVVNRLNSDFDNVHQRINDSSYLEYEGSSIKADNTYYGLTKDLSIKGRTLQNCYPPIERENFINLLGGTVENGYIHLVGRAPGYSNAWINLNKSILKPKTVYTLIIDIKENTLIDVLTITSSHIDDCFKKAYTITDKTTGIIKLIVETKDEFTDTMMSMRTYLNSVETGAVKFRIMCIEGNHTNTSISELPFGEGIYSVGESENNLINVKSCGKNLFRYEDVRPRNSLSVVEYGDNSVTITDEYYCGSIIKIKRNTRYYVSATRTLLLGEKGGQIAIFKSDGKSVQGNTPIKTLGVKDGWFDSEDNEYISFLMYGGSASLGTCKFSNVQVEEIKNTETTGTNYFAPIWDNQNIQLDEPLRSLPNGVYDEIVGDNLIRRIKKVDFGGSNYNKFDYWNAVNGASENYIRGYCYYRSIPGGIEGKRNSKIMCDKHPINTNNPYKAETAGILGVNDYIGLVIPINCIPNFYSLDGTAKGNALKNWIKNNPFTVYYELAEPIVTKLPKKAELKTFDGTTHFTSNNKLLPSLSVKVPTNVQAVLQDTRARNRELENELETTTLKLKEADNILKEMDTDLIKTNWEMDDRLFEVEWALEDAGLVTSVSTFNINNKMRGSASVMALSKFEQAKIIIMSGDYDRATLEGQLSKYLKRNIIAQDEYDTLISMMDAKEIVVGE
ncbi:MULTISPECIES: hypothetical protein [unclassified Clostridium]|uniref:hypothetical protein n=1 Tax=unclassified Clostridium TaxID=2614128 RepID=UPI001C8BEC10|nr:MULTISPECIES: hypothetical protein [unclassified Clostridium]MBX9136734.1 hypothetical protein [Clostridium sp. K12(2020)]MBX9145159.1 hypothetical protein [Clostridium sp. K13]